MPQVTWGNWNLNRNSACLEYINPTDNAMFYQIALDEIKRSSHILDWLYQIEEKSWASHQDVGQLVEAFSTIFGRGIAGSGVDGTVDPRKILTEAYGINFSSI